MKVDLNELIAALGIEGSPFSEQTIEEFEQVMTKVQKELDLVSEYGVFYEQTRELLQEEDKAVS